MRVALAQLHVEGADVAGNRERAREAVARAADRGADLVALPEAFHVGYFAFDAYPRSRLSISSSRLRFKNRSTPGTRPSTTNRFVSLVPPSTASRVCSP